MKKKYLIIMLITFFLSVYKVSAEGYCDIETVKEMSKILYHETGTVQIVSDESENFFMRLVTASVILNNAYRDGQGSTMKSKIYSLSDNQYGGHSTYRDKSFEEILSGASANAKGESLYISALILSGKFNAPKNIIGQSSCRCLLGTKACSKEYDGDCTGEDGWGVEWTHVDTIKGYFNVYFGYSKYDESIESTDVFGKKLASTTPSYYRNLAKNFKLSNYEKYNSDNVCNLVSNASGGGGSTTPNPTNPTPSNPTNPTPSPSNPETPGDSEVPTLPDQDLSSGVTIILKACENPDVLRVILFFKIILNIVRIAIPIGLIIIGTLDFSKAMISSDENDQKKNFKLFGNRLLYAALIFLVPWIVEVVLIFLGSFSQDLNFAECITNADSAKIEELERDQNQN